MNAIKKFSVLLLLMTAVLLGANALVKKGSTDAPKAITSQGYNGALEFEPGTNVKPDTAIKTHTATCACGQLTVTTVGPDPERRSLCHCHLCQKQSGSCYSVQARFPKEQVTIKGKSTAWKFPGKDGNKVVTGRTCGDGGGTFHFCPVCGTTVWYTVDADTARIGVKAGTFADPSFPAPNITGFEEFMFPYVMNLSEHPMQHVK